MHHHHELAFWAAECAERVLALFETESPNDLRPRQAIEAARQWQRGDLSITEARKLAFAAHAAARQAISQAAMAAARAAGHAAATAHVGTHAPHAANYACKAIEAARLDTDAERQWQSERLPEDLRQVIAL